ncbi:MAG: hypothetical protein ACQESE_01200 [Nanobdellota archaeon]
MKSQAMILVALLLSILLVSSPVLSLDCVKGIDGYCDEACREVDFDCASNPNLEAKIQTDLEKNDSTPRQDPYREIHASDTLILIGTKTIPEYEARKPTNDHINENMGVLLLAIAISLIFISITLLIIHRMELKQGDDTRILENMKFHIKRLRRHGHSDEDIKKMFLHKNHHSRMIDKAFKALEKQA